MSFDISVIRDWDNQKETNIDFSMSGKGWREYLDMAVAYGWKPMGVTFITEEDGQEVYGEEKTGAGDVEVYFTNDGAFMDEEDIANLITALHRVPEKDYDLVKFMSYLSGAKGLSIW